MAIGGDRYWISPEREYFYKNPETWTDWFCPSELDPANYEILDDNQEVLFTLGFDDFKAIHAAQQQ